MSDNKEEEEEIWKQYPEFDFIEVSNLGRVRTIDHWVSDGKNSKRLVKGKVLKQQLLPNGYLYVHIYTNGKTVNRYVHRMVAICFIPNIDNYPEINHIDCNPTNNRSDNLEWCTHEYNCQYREKYGKARNRPVIAINLDTFEIIYFESQSEASCQLHINVGHMNEVVKGKRHRAGGCWLCDADENAVKKVRKKFGDEIALKVEELMKNK